MQQRRSKLAYALSQLAGWTSWAVFSILAGVIIVGWIIVALLAARG